MRVATLLGAIIIALSTGTACVVAQTAAADVQDPSDTDVAWQHYQHVLSGSTLEWLVSQPFLLKVNFELYDLDGHLAEKGTAEESWTKAGGKIVRIQSPSLTEDSTTYDVTKTHKRESFLVHQALKAIVRPFPSRIEQKDFALDEFQQQVNGLSLSCFALEAKGTWKGTQPSYCTDIDNRLVAMTGPLFTIERSDFRKFRGHETPSELKLSYEGKTAVTMHVTELDALPEEPDAVDKPNPKPSAPVVPGSVVSGTRLTKKDPEYPKGAKKKHIAGSVLLSAVISKEGTINYLEVIASPDALLTQSAIDAVKTWTYKPYIINGEPVALDTTITVNYALKH